MGLEVFCCCDGTSEVTGHGGDATKNIFEATMSILWVMLLVRLLSALSSFCDKIVRLNSYILKNY